MFLIDISQTDGSQKLKQALETFSLPSILPKAECYAACTPPTRRRAVQEPVAPPDVIRVRSPPLPFPRRASPVVSASLLVGLAVIAVVQVPRSAASQARRHVDAGWAWVVGAEVWSAREWRFRVTRWPAARSGPEGAGGRRPGSPSRLFLAAAEISQLSLPLKLATGLLIRPSVHLGLLSSLSNLDTWAVGSSGGSGLWFGEPELLLPQASASSG